MKYGEYLSILKRYFTIAVIIFRKKCNFPSASRRSGHRYNCYLHDKFRVRFPTRSNRTQYHQRFATAATFLRNCVAQALSRVNGPTTRYTLRRNTTSVRMFDFDFFTSISSSPPTLLKEVCRFTCIKTKRYTQSANACNTE